MADTSYNADVMIYLPAFPGAEGWGSTVTGGRGGTVCVVTRLDDADPPEVGMFRWAVSYGTDLDSRYVVFAVSGVIELTSQISVRPNTTIAGETAPGDGICLQAGLDLASNTIVRYIRIRPLTANLDGISIDYQTNIIIDHCSFSWLEDDGIGFKRWESEPPVERNVTIQWCIIGETEKGCNAWHAHQVTFHHNLWVHVEYRCPVVTNSIGTSPSRFDMRNMVIYDCGTMGMASRNITEVNSVGNYVILSQPLIPERKVELSFQLDGPGLLYIDDTYGPWVKDGEAQWVEVRDYANLYVSPDEETHRSDTPFDAPAVTTTSSAQAFLDVLDRAGACLPKRDVIDERFVNDVRNNLAARTYPRGPVDAHARAALYWPTLSYNSVPAPLDSDSDGMPDYWEIAHGLDPYDPSDASVDSGNGYDNLEIYLHYLAVYTHYYHADVAIRGPATASYSADIELATVAPYFSDVDVKGVGLTTSYSANIIPVIPGYENYYSDVKIPYGVTSFADIYSTKLNESKNYRADILIAEFENFLLYTEVDPTAALTVDVFTVSGWIDTNIEAYLYRDKGIGHFSGDFKHSVDIETKRVDTGAKTTLWAVSNVINNSFYWLSNLSEALLVYLIDGTGLSIKSAANGASSSSYTLTIDTMYYLDIERVGTTTTLSIYGSADRVIPLSTLSVTEDSALAYRYVFPVCSYNSGATGNDTSIVVYNLDLHEIEATTVNISYISDTYIINDLPSVEYASDIYLTKEDESTSHFADVKVANYEDFTSYTTVDALELYDVYQNYIVTGWVDTNNEAYVYDDKNAGHFSGDFEHFIDIKSKRIDTGAEIIVYALSNVVDDACYWQVNNSQALMVILMHGNQLSIRACENGDTDGSFTITIGTIYYLKIKRVGDTTTLYIYNDSGRLVPNAAYSVTENTVRSYRYVYPISSFNSGATGNDSQVEIYNLDLQDTSIVGDVVYNSEVYMTQENVTVTYEADIEINNDKHIYYYADINVSPNPRVSISYNTDVFVLMQHNVSYNSDCKLAASLKNSWKCSWPIEINADSVISSDVTDWPCLITDVHFPTEVWDYMNVDASDLRFTSDANGLEELYYDLVRVNVAGHSTYLYVRVTNLDSGNNTVIYAWAGNPNSVAPSAEWMTNTYRDSIIGWWPIEEGADTTTYDRTTNSNDGTLVNTEAEDWVQAADGSWSINMDSVGEFVDFIGATGLDPGTGDYSVSMTFYDDRSGTTPRWCRYITKVNATSAPYEGWQVVANDDSDTELMVHLTDTSGNISSVIIPRVNSAWDTLTFTADRDSNLTVYRNASVVGTPASLASVGDVTTAKKMRIAIYDATTPSSQYFDGKWARLMIHNVALSTDEVATDYLMHSSPSTWAAAGDVQLYAVDYKADILLREDLTYSADVLLSSILIIPKKRIIQPNIKPDITAVLNTNHPLAHGLIAAWLFNEGSGDTVHDYSGNDAHAMPYVASAFSWGSGPSGWARTKSAQNRYHYAPGGALTSLPDGFSVVFEVSQLASIYQYPDIITNASSNHGFLIQQYQGYVGRYDFFVWNGTASTRATMSSSMYAAGEWVRVAVTWDGTNIRCYANGVIGATLALSTTYAGNGANIQIGHDDNATWSDLSIYSCVLTADEVAWLHAEPYAMFEYPTDKRYISISGDTGPTKNISYLSDVIKLKENNDISYNADLVIYETKDISEHKDTLIQTESDITYNADIDAQGQFNLTYNTTIITQQQDTPVIHFADTNLFCYENIYYADLYSEMGFVNKTYSAEVRLVYPYSLSYSSEVLTETNYTGKKVVAAKDKLLVSGSWNIINISDEVTDIYEIHQVEDDLLLACTEQGLWKSEDHAATWAKMPITKIWADLRGEVKNSSDQDIINAEVILLGTPNNFAFATHTDGSGNYEFTNIDTSHNFVLMASCLPNYGITFISPLELDISEDKEEIITLPSATAGNGHLVGIMSDLTNSDALTGSTVKLIGAETYYTTTTDEYVGLFYFTNLEPGYYELEFSKNGYFSEEKRSVFINTDEITYTNVALKKLTARGELSDIEVTVLDSASSEYIYDTQVSLSNLSAISYEVDMYYTDVLGKAILTNVPNGRYLLEIKKQNYEVYTLEVDIQSSSSLTYEVELVSLTSGGLEGFVIDISTNLPISDATVAINGEEITTDSNGYYSVNSLQQARYSITVSKTGYNTATFYGVVKDNIVSNHNCYLCSTTITAHSSITLNVHSQADMPVNEATVTINGAFSYAQATDEHGNITFSYLPYNTYHISVNKDYYIANGVTLTTSSTSNTLSKYIAIEEINSENTATIIGRVATVATPVINTFPAGRVNDEGDTQTKRWLSELMVPEGITGATIYLSGQGKYAVNAQGRFVISNLEAGTYQLLIQHDDYNDIIVKWMHLDAGEILDLNNLIFTTSDILVKGTVYHITEYYDTLPHATIMDKDTEEIRFCDGEGNYEWQNYRSNRGSLTAIKNGYIPSSFSREALILNNLEESVFRQINSNSAGEFEYNFELREADEDSIFWGFVLDDRNGNPIANATVTIGDFSTTSNSNGFYIIKEYYGDPIAEHTGSSDLGLYKKPTITVTHSDYFTKNSPSLFPQWPTVAVQSKTSTIGDFNFNLARVKLYPYYIKIKGTVLGETGYLSDTYEPISHAQVVLSSSEGEGEIDPEIGGYLIEKQLTANTSSPNFEFYLVYAEPPQSIYNIYATHYSNWWNDGSATVTVTPSEDPVYGQYSEIEVEVKLRVPKYPDGGGTLYETYSSNPLANGRSFIWGHMVESISGRSLAQSQLDLLNLPQERLIPQWSYGNRYSIKIVDANVTDAINKLRYGLTIATNSLAAKIYVKNFHERYFADTMLIGRETNLLAKILVVPTRGSRYIDSDQSSQLSAKLFVSYDTEASSSTSTVSDFYHDVVLPASTTVLNSHERLVGHSFFAQIGVANRDYDRNGVLFYASSEGGSDSDGVFFIEWLEDKLSGNYNYINEELFFEENPSYTLKYSSINEILDTIDVHERKFNLGYQNTYGPLNFSLAYPFEYFDEEIEDPDPNDPPDYPGAVSYVTGLQLNLHDYSSTSYWGQFSKIQGTVTDTDEVVLEDVAVSLWGGFRDQKTYTDNMDYDTSNYKYEPVWSGYLYQIVACKSGYKPKVILITSVSGEAPSVGTLASGDLVINDVNIGSISQGASVVTQGAQLAEAINDKILLTNVYADYNQSTGALTLYQTESDENIEISGNDLSYTGLTAGTYYPSENIELPRDKTLAVDTKINVIDYAFNIELSENNSSEAGLFGYVLDENGNALENVIVTLDSYSATTDVNGFYVLNAIAGSYSVLSIEKSGYIIQEMNGIILNNGEYIRRNSCLLAEGVDYGQLRLVGEVSVGVHIYGVIGIDEVTDGSGIVMVSALPSGTYYVVYNKSGAYADEGIVTDIVVSEIITESIVVSNYISKKIQIFGMVLQQLDSSSLYDPYDDSKLVDYKQAKYSSKILKLDGADVAYDSSSVTASNRGIYSIEVTDVNSLNITASKDSDNFYAQSLGIEGMEAGEFYSRSFILVNDVKQIAVYTVLKTEEKFTQWNVLVGTNYGVLALRF